MYENSACAMPRPGLDGTDPAEGTENIRADVLPVGCVTGLLGWRRDLCIQSLFITAGETEAKGW